MAIDNANAGHARRGSKRTCPDGPTQGRSARLRRRRAWCCCVALACLPAQWPRAASFEPGKSPDPATGDTAVQAAQADASSAVEGNGIRWAFGPLRWGGRLSLDLRALRLPEGTRINQAIVANDLDFATYVHAPWFIQLQGGLGVMVSRDAVRGTESPVDGGTNVSLTGRLGFTVFPASRFPFEFRSEVGDSRTSADFLGDEYRSYRLGITQSYRPESGRDLYTLGFDRSRLVSDRWGTDTVDAFTATAVRYLDEHTFELTASLVANERSDTGDESRLHALTGRHAFQPASSLHVDTMASWHDSSFEFGTSRFDTDLKQLTTMATWRPREGEWLYFEDSPLYITGTARVVDAQAGRDDLTSDTQSVNATLGVSQDVTPHLRVSVAVAGNATRITDLQTSRGALVSAGVNYTPEAIRFGEWRYGPAISLTGGVSHSNLVGTREAIGGQLMHGLTRSAAWDDGSSVTFNLNQSLGVLRESQTDVLARAVAHAVGLSWQGSNNNGTQSFAALTLSEARNVDTTRGYFQLGNLQLSQRWQASRYASVSGNLTAQSSRSDVTLIDPFTGELRSQSPGWQHFYSGGLNFEHHRFLGVPRLRASLIASASTQQFERRVFGDIEAPRQRVTESIEGRLDYGIGRLEARLSARVARVEGKKVAGVFLRLQRSY